MLLQHLSAVAGLISSIGSLLSPVVIGVVAAYLLDPLALFAENKLLGRVRNEDRRRGIASILAVLFVILLIVLFFVVLSQRCGCIAQLPVLR